MKKRKGLILLFLGVLAFVGWQHFNPSNAYKRSPIQNPFPSTNSITEARIRIQGEENILVPRADYPLLAKMFSEARQDPSPSKWVSIYDVDLLVDGLEIRVAVFDAGAPGAFRIGKTYFRGGRDAEFHSFLERIKTVQKSLQK